MGAGLEVDIASEFWRRIERIQDDLVSGDRRGVYIVAEIEEDGGTRTLEGYYSGVQQVNDDEDKFVELQVKIGDNPPVSPKKFTGLPDVSIRKS